MIKLAMLLKRNWLKMRLQVLQQLPLIPPAILRLEESGETEALRLQSTQSGPEARRQPPQPGEDGGRHQSVQHTALLHCGTFRVNKL